MMKKKIAVALLLITIFILTPMSSIVFTTCHETWLDKIIWQVYGPTIRFISVDVGGFLNAVYLVTSIQGLLFSIVIWLTGTMIIKRFETRSFT